MHQMEINFYSFWHLCIFGLYNLSIIYYGLIRYGHFGIISFVVHRIKLMKKNKIKVETALADLIDIN